MIRQLIKTIIILTLFSTVVSAQTTRSRFTVKDTVEAITFCDNLLLEIAGGSQLLFSADANNLDFKDRLTPHASISLGKWFSPVIGAGIKAEGYSLNGFSTSEGEYTAANDNSLPFDQDPVRKEVTINPDGTYRHFIRYLNFSFNVYLSLTNLIFGYNEKSVFNLITSAGIGDMYVFNYKGIPSKSSLSGNAGLTMKFHLSPKLDLNLNSSATAFPNEFEGRIAGSNDYENYVTANIGLAYYFKGRKFINRQID
ncbi:MAG: hypothetical protein GX126_00855 [Bacteroidales bacterium]|jgi:hypothetical protein|nr:hypothetical protein [Bacteroidales bacterium]